MHAVTFAVNRTKWKFQFFYDDILGFIGLTDARLRLMQVIDSSEAPCQAELAAKLGISRQTVNETLGALIRKGLIEKTPSVVDKRKRIIALNAAGKKLLARVWAIYLRSGIANRAAARTLIDVPKKPEKIPQVIALLRNARIALFEQSTYRPRKPYDEEIDHGAPLEGEDRAIFDAVVKYCRDRFMHLPFDYLMST
jgi:DNA-binding MarR family transcriptional regulator